MTNNKFFNFLIIFLAIVIFILTSFLGYQLLIVNRPSALSTTLFPDSPTPTSVQSTETFLFFAVVDSLENSQIHLTIINPPQKTTPQSVISRSKIAKPITYFGAIKDIFIPSQHFQKQPSVSDTLEVYGELNNEDQSFAITKISLIK